MAFGIVRQIVSNAGLTCPVEGKIPYRIFYEAVRDELAAVQHVSDTSLTRGVIVSTALSLRAIPFEYIFVVGLGGGQFPNPEIRDPLDLRDRQEPQRGDLSPTDRDRALFLEILLAAKKSLTLSWVAKEATTGERLEPSSVISQLRWYLKERFGIPKKSDDELTQEHPLHRFDKKYFSAKPLLTPSLHREALEEYVLQALRDKLVDDGGEALTMPTLQELRELPFDPDMRIKDVKKPSKVWRRLKKQLAFFELPDEVEREEAREEFEDGDDPARRVYISLSQLRRFLESPLQGAAQIQLGLREEEEDLFAKIREDLVCDRLNSAIILRGAAHQALVDGNLADELTALYDDEFLEEGVLKGQLPAGHFLKAQREAHLDTLNIWWQNLEEHQLLGSEFTTIGIGRDGADKSSRLDALEFDLKPKTHGVGEPLKVIITGVTEPTTPDGNIYMTFVTSAATGKEESARERYFLRGLLSWIAATAAGRVGEGDIKFILNTKHQRKPSGKDKEWPHFVRQYKALSQQEAHDYLEYLVSEVMTKPHDYLLPIQAVADLDKELVDEERSDAILGYFQRYKPTKYRSSSDQYGPIQDLKRFRGPEDPEIVQTLKARFPHLFGGLR